MLEMSVLQLNRLEKRVMDEIQTLRQQVTAAAATPSVNSELMKEVDSMRATVAKVALVSSESAAEIADLKTLIAKLSEKMEVLACKCAGKQKKAEPAPEPKV